MLILKTSYLVSETEQINLNVMLIRKTTFFNIANSSTSVQKEYTPYAKRKY